MGTGPWGEGTWGAGSWGGGADGDGDLVGVAALPIRENVLRVEFTGVVYFTGLLESADASVPEKWSVSEVLGTVGLDGNAVRPVRVVGVSLSTEEDGVAGIDHGRFVSLTLDRPMTPWPARYSVSWTQIFSADLSDQAEGLVSAEAVYRRVEPPTLDEPRRSLDVANPQTVAAARSASGSPYSLGTFAVDDSGDVATDSGTASLKKRALRRVFTKKNAFAHLRGYGVGLGEYAKQLAKPSVVSFLQADCEAQIAREPDVAKVRVRILPNPDKPSLFVLRVAIKPKVGKPFAFGTHVSSE